MRASDAVELLRFAVGHKDLAVAQELVVDQWLAKITRSPENQHKNDRLYSVFLLICEVQVFKYC